MRRLKITSKSFLDQGHAGLHMWETATGAPFFGLFVYPTPRDVLERPYGHTQEEEGWYPPSSPSHM